MIEYQPQYFHLCRKALVVSTLLLAAAPTIIVTLLPSFFAMALQFITPLLIILPPMAIATAALGGIILGLKITEYALQKQSQKNVVASPQQTQEQSIDKLFLIQRVASAINGPVSRTFFAEIQDQKEDEFINHTWTNSVSL